MINEKDLAEQILSNQERAIVRQIQRVSKLSDSLVMLEKSTSNMSQLATSFELSKLAMLQVDDIKKYLNESIAKIILSTKVPSTNSSPDVK